MPIINGVNVAGCEFYQIEANELYPKAQYCGSMRNTFCENEPNCYYEQLKRLEQENEKLTKQRDILLGQLVINDGEDVTVQISQSQFDEYNELKAENEKLKQYKALDAFLKGKIDYKQTIADIVKENEKLKHKIETILKRKKDNCTCEDCYNEGLWEGMAIGSYEEVARLKHTLQEIKDYLNTLSGIDNDFVNTETYLRILDLITKAEEE